MDASRVERARAAWLEFTVPPRRPPSSEERRVLELAEPAKREGGAKVEDVAELVDKLMNEAKVI